ncbi:MAG: hypothetical protein OXH38_07170 [Chloroflexi bacterium]|nr:hypothetical protein [Chloroflexota bacterium]
MSQATPDDGNEPEQIWSSQLRIAAGRAVDDAPQLGFAEQVDQIGRVVRLSILAEPASDGADAFIDQFVRRIGELFDPAARSLTGALKLAVDTAHEELRNWNRQRLPQEHAMYGLSCLIQRAGQPAVLGQCGPSAALLAGAAGQADLRRLSFHAHAPAASIQDDDPVASPVGAAAPLSMEFAAAPDAGPGWALLFTSNAVPLFDPELRVALSRLAVEQTLPHLYPIILHLRDAAALAVGSAVPSSTSVPSRPSRPASPSGPSDEAEQAAPRQSEAADELGSADEPQRSVRAGQSNLAATDQRAAHLADHSQTAAAPVPPPRPAAPEALRFDPQPFSELEAVGWPVNPFAVANVQRLEGVLPRIVLPPGPLRQPILDLRRALPSLGEDRAEPSPQRPEIRPHAPITRSASARRVGIVLTAMIALLVGVAAVLLGPSLWRSDDDQFRSHLERARNGLAASELSVATESARLALQDARIEVETALDLNPLAPEALQLREQIEAVLGELNLVQSAGELSTLVDLSEFGPAIALGAVRAGGGRTFVLDDAGGRVFAVGSEGTAQVIFLEGESLGLGSRLRAGRPISIAWQPRQPNAADGLPANDGLWILDSNARLFRWTDSGVLLVPIPELDRLGSVDAIAATAGSVFLLDQSGGAVWRFAVARDELGDPARAVGRTDLLNASELRASVNAEGIVEFLVASNDGRLRRFRGNEELPLALDLQRELLAPASISLGAESGLIYVVDRGRGRIVAVGAEGSVISQIQSPEIAELRGAWVDESSGQVVYALPDTLLVGRLPSGQE